MSFNDVLRESFDSTTTDAGVVCNGILELDVPMSAASELRTLDAGAESRDQSALYFGTAHASQCLRRQLIEAAATPYSVLLVGPTGAGKTAVAELLHRLSDRRSGPFVARSLPSIPEELRHAELSGIVRGAFTGATVNRVGAVESAHRGTLFLDELGHASLALQQTLLTIVEGKSVQRVGDSTRRWCDVRFVFASSLDVGELVSTGRLLQELLYRIADFTIFVPPLRDRREDIAPLAQRFLIASLRDLGRTFPATMSHTLRKHLESASWPGNIRELQATCRRLALRARPGVPLEISDLSPFGGDAGSAERVPSARDRAVDALKRAGGNKAKASRELGISRSRLYRLLVGD